MNMVKKLKKNITLDNLAGMVQRGFLGVDKKFNEVYERFDKISKRIDGLDNKIDALYLEVSSIDKKINKIDERLAKIEIILLEDHRKRIGRLEEQMQTLQASFH